MRSPRGGAHGTCPAALVPLYYVESSSRPAVAPSSSRRARGIDETLDILDGIVFSGGIDIDPAQYGAERHPATDPAQVHRDAGELRLLEAALERDLPTLAICRGFQLLNILRGGDLIQHLPEHVGHEGHRETPGVFSQHPVEVKEGTRLEAILGPRHGAVSSATTRASAASGRASSRARSPKTARSRRSKIHRRRSRSACSGTRRWRPTTSACSRRSSVKRCRLPRALGKVVAEGIQSLERRIALTWKGYRLSTTRPRRCVRHTGEAASSGRRRTDMMTTTGPGGPAPFVRGHDSRRPYRAGDSKGVPDPSSERWRAPRKGHTVCPPWTPSRGCRVTGIGGAQNDEIGECLT